MESNVALSTWLIVFGMFVVLFAVPMAILEYERRREIRRLERGCGCFLVRKCEGPGG